MDNKIFILVNMFSLESKVVLAAPGSEPLELGSYGIKQIPEAVVALAHEHNTYNVQISGGEKYSQLIEYGIESAEMAKYNENKIKVEVI